MLVNKYDVQLFFVDAEVDFPLFFILFLGMGRSLMLILLEIKVLESLKVLLSLLMRTREVQFLL